MISVDNGLLLAFPAARPCSGRGFLQNPAHFLSDARSACRDDGKKAGRYTVQEPFRSRRRMLIRTTSRFRMFRRSNPEGIFKPFCCRRRMRKPGPFVFGVRHQKGVSRHESGIILPVPAFLSLAARRMNPKLGGRLAAFSGSRSAHAAKKPKARGKSGSMACLCQERMLPF